MAHKCYACPREFETLQGWKRHCSAAHGGYTDAEVAAASGFLPDTQGSASSVIDSMLGADADTNAQPEVKIADSVTTGPASAPAPTAKRVKATPKRLKKLISSIPERIFAGYEMELDDEDKEAIEEATEFVQEIYGLEFQVPEDKTVIRNRAWAFLWVVGVLVLVFVKHRFKEFFAQTQAKAEPPVQEL